MITHLMLPVGMFDFLLVLAGIYSALKDGRSKHFHVFDFFFIGATAIAFVLANYLWFIIQDEPTGTLVGVWAVGNAAIGLYFRSMFTRSNFE
jgi:hypothetical protein